MTNEITKASPFEITTFAEAERYAKMIAESDFAPKDYKGKPGNVLIAMQMGHELGIPASQAIQNIAVINGRPSLYGDLALALIRKNPECVSVTEWMVGTIKGGDAICYCEVIRGKETIKREFSVKQAIQANLLGKAGTWTQYPERMLQMRARGFALRDSFPDVLKGVYVEGELVEEPESQIIEHKEEPAKLGIAAVKQAIAKDIDNSIVQYAQEESAGLKINPETGEIIESGAPTFADVLKQLQDSKTVEELIIAKDVARSLGLNEEQKKIINDEYKKMQAKIK